MSETVRVLLSEEEVDRRIAEIAAQISRDYEGKEIHMICVLKGGVFFTCELSKRVTVPVSMDFMSVSSYGADTKSSGVVKIVKDLDLSIQGKDVLAMNAQEMKRLRREMKVYQRLPKKKNKPSESAPAGSVGRDDSARRP